MTECCPSWILLSFLYTHRCYFRKDIMRCVMHWELFTRWWRSPDCLESVQKCQCHGITRSCLGFGFVLLRLLGSDSNKRWWCLLGLPALLVSLSSEMDGNFIPCFHHEKVKYLILSLIPNKRFVAYYILPTRHCCILFETLLAKGATYEREVVGRTVEWESRDRRLAE